MKGEKKNDVKIKEKGKKKGGMRGNRKKIEGKPIFDVEGGNHKDWNNNNEQFTLSE